MMRLRLVARALRSHTAPAGRASTLQSVRGMAYQPASATGGIPTAAIVTGATVLVAVLAVSWLLLTPATSPSLAYAIH